MAKKDSKTAARVKHTVYTDTDPGLEEGILRAMADARIFSTFCCSALRKWLLDHGYGDKEYKGEKFSTTKFE